MVFPDLGTFDERDGLVSKPRTSDNRFQVGRGDVMAIAATRDDRVEFVGFRLHTLAAVQSTLGHPAYYPIVPIEMERPVRAVLMDLDGTSVHSEAFWVWLIERTIARLRAHQGFELESVDAPFVAGHSVSEHLQYCIDKYCPGRSLEDARRLYFELAHAEVHEILEGRGRVDAFAPAPGLADFLQTLKRHRVKIALVTSGLHEKAWPEILAVFRQLRLGDPAAFYDAIITAGFPLRQGSPGTLGELSPKPHPWLYAEAARVGLGLTPDERSKVVGLEDSGAGVCAVRLAGFTPFGIAGGTILQSGTRALCRDFCTSLQQVLDCIL